MVGVFLYYVKPPSNIEYFCKKTTTKILSEDDEVIVRNRHLYYIHHIDGSDIDKMDDESLIKRMNDEYGYSIQLPITKSKKGYKTADERYYIRIVRQNKKWFKDMCGI